MRGSIAAWAVVAKYGRNIPRSDKASVAEFLDMLHEKRLIDLQNIVPLPQAGDSIHRRAKDGKGS